MGFKNIAPAGRDSLRALRRLLSDRNWHVRLAAVLALRNQGETAICALSDLFALKRDPNERGRSAAKHAVHVIQWWAD